VSEFDDVLTRAVDYFSQNEDAHELVRTLEYLIVSTNRYHFLRSQPDNTDAPRIDVVHWTVADESANEGAALRGEQLDAAIDAAMKEQA